MLYGYCGNSSLYKDDDVINKGVRPQGRKMRYGGFFIIFDSLFYSKRLAKYEIYFCSDMISMVKSNTKLFCKDNIDNITKH